MSNENILERARSTAAGRCSTVAGYWNLLDELIAEVERLRSLTLDQQYIMDDMDKEIIAKDARIKELEAEAQEYHDKKEEALTLCAGQNRYIERLEAAFLAEYQRGCVMLSPTAAREALEKIREGGKDDI